MFVVLFGFAGLALDAGHLYLVHRNTQNAADAAALAAGKRLAGSQWTGPPTSSNDLSTKAAHDIAASDGVPTTLNTLCDKTTPNSPQPGLSQFSTTWYDTTVACGAATGFTSSISIYSPPQTLTPHCTTTPYNCMQVVITRQVQNYLMGILGTASTTITASAAVFSEPAGAVLSVPAPIAVYLYQPQSGCNSLNQGCFDETKPPQRSLLNCKGTPNCPTLWIQTGSTPLIAGINGSIVSSGTDTVATEANGDVVLQDATGTTICDPFGGATCNPQVVTGVKGFALAAGSKVYCSTFAGGGSPGAYTPCTTAGPGGAALGPVYSNETAFTALTWTSSVDTSNLPYCGALILNGGKVANSFTAGSPQCLPQATQPYTIQPGRYDYIVVNHGAYDFESGVYDITGTAPVNAVSTAGALANGIDHSGETAADWDLCTTAAGNPLACPGLTAGIWIGHGTLGFVAAAPTTPGPCNTPGPTQGGGGDPVQITGNGATFRFEGPLSGSFVSTHEVDFIGLVSPGLGQQRRTAGVPLLFDLENDSFIHLDADGDDLSSHFKGIIYQIPTAKYGGVEVNPGLAGSSGQAAAVGQVLAYSFTTFGSPGFAVDFSKGLGAATVPVESTGGEEEPEILTSASLVDPGIAGKEQLVVQYNDEWKLDAYDVYVKINNNSPLFFSQGIWNPVPPAGQPLPPNPNGSGPSDNNPAYPALAQDSLSNYVKTTDGLGKPDWKMTYGDGSTFEVNGDWMWGHEESLAGAIEGTDAATLRYAFPIPSGSQVTITIFMSDGDSCGDFATATWTFNNIGSPGSGQQATGAVHLEQ